MAVGAEELQVFNAVVRALAVDMVADALALAEQIKNLPSDKRETIEALVRGYLSTS